MTAARTAGTKLESAPIAALGLSGYRGKFVVVKIGGSDEAASASIFQDIARLRAEGVKVVVVHGGGKALSHWLKLAGHQTRFVDGLRVTDAETLEVAVMVFAGKVNKEIVSRFAKLGLRAVGISGVDGGLVLVEPETHPPGLGLVGRIVAVDTLLLDRLVESEMVPVVAPVAADRNGQMYNVNADTVAAEIAGALGAASL
ncbi:MAG: acetylglutamate kinase, partial [Chloroflexi bacterium]|nr:acetylglutamate kinase [Chloroflexota bacterium]